MNSVKENEVIALKDIGITHSLAAVVSDLNLMDGAASFFKIGDTKWK